MAYARFYNTDIYIYPHVQGHIECSACILIQEDNPHHLFPKSESIYNDEQLLAHIAEHRYRGHDIPVDLEQEILSDPDRYSLNLDQK
jgi:hypothetical protein